MCEMVWFDSESILRLGPSVFDLDVFDYQYLRKECINFFDFLHGYILQGKVACETTVFGWVYLGMPSNAQTCLDLPGLPVGSLRVISS